jgi:hypothetical protein
MSSLPKVASNFFTMCKKCGQERYHKVLAHSSADTAKLECEVCHTKKNYKLNEGTKVAAKKTGGKKTKASEAKAAAAQNARYVELTEKMGNAKPQPYRMAAIYPIDAKIEHPKFGVGYVVASFPDKIEVVFEDVNRNLVQGRK